MVFLCAALNQVFPSLFRIFRRLLFDDGSSSSKKKNRRLVYRQQSDGYIEKYDFKGQPTVVVPDFEPEVFKQLMEYCHTGSVMLQSQTLLGLMNAADHYALDELKVACIQFLERAINTDTVCSLLSSAEKYIQYKSTKILVQKMLEFVEEHAEVVLNLSSFSTLPQHIVRIILGRDDLRASEKTKFEAAFRWCLHYLADNSDEDLKTLFEPFVGKIKFHKIPASHLMKSVKPAEVVDDSVILTALAYQADPQSVNINKPNVPVPSGRATTSPSTEGGIQTFESSPLHFRRVKSTGAPIKSMSHGNFDLDVIDGSLRIERSGSVPPADHRLDPHPTRVFEIRTNSRTSDLSLSSMDSTTSFSSGPRSPVIGRSTSSSSQFSAEVDLPRNQSTTNSEHFMSLASSSIEV